MMQNIPKIPKYLFYYNSRNPLFLILKTVLFSIVVLPIVKRSRKFNDKKEIY